MCNFSEAATQWRKENGKTGVQGVVIFFDGELQGWINKLRNPERQMPGCIAIDENGRKWESTGGNEHTGAEHWQQIN